MKVRSLRVASIVLAFVAGGFVAAGPAHAEPPPVPQISTPDVSTTGHVKVTVTTDAPYAFAEVIGYYQTLPVTNGSASFDFETWGMRDAVLAYYVCPDKIATYGACSPISYVDFTATDVVPEVTWPSDDTVSYGTPVQITISDPSGGGLIRATLGDHTYWLDRNGTTTFTPNGTGDMEVERCGATSPLRCVPFEPAQKIPFEARSTSASLVDPLGDRMIGALTSNTPDVLATAHTPYPNAPTTLRWQFDPSMIEQPAHEVTGTTDANGDLVFHVTSADFANRPEGNYVIDGTIAQTFPEFGEVTGIIVPDGGIVVDTVSPVVNSVKLTTAGPIFPSSTSARWGWADGAATMAMPPPEEWTPEDATLEMRVRDSSDAIVATWQTGPQMSDRPYAVHWHGRDDSGQPLAPGSYQLSVRAVDLWGNASDWSPLGAVQIRSGVPKLVHKTFTVSAQGSLYSSSVGRCSTLRRPALRGWWGSIGLYSQTRCSLTGPAALIRTYHRMRAPAALAYEGLRVNLVGGAARASSSSKLRWGLRGPEPGPSGYLDSDMAGPAVGVHRPSATHPATSALTSGGYLRWGTTLYRAQRYEVRSFQVDLAYWVVD